MSLEDVDLGSKRVSNGSRGSGADSDGFNMSMSHREMNDDDARLVFFFNDALKTNERFEFAGNSIRTAKYSVLSFLPRNLFEQFHKDIYESWVKNKEMENSDIVKVDMKHWFGNLILNIVVRSISGKRFAPDDEEGVRFQAVTRRFFELLGVFVVSDLIPLFKGLDFGGYKKSIKITTKEMDTFFEEWLKEHKKERNG